MECTAKMDIINVRIDIDIDVSVDVSIDICHYYYLSNGLSAIALRRFDHWDGISTY